MKSLTIVNVLRKTFVFIILRLVVIIGTIVSIIWITGYFVGFFFRLFNLNVNGIVSDVFYLNFAMIGCIIGVLVFGFVRKTILFYIKAAHVIAITKLCTDDVESSLVISSIKELIQRFISINLFYLFNGLVMKGTRDIGNLIFKQNIVPFLSPNGDNEKASNVFNDVRRLSDNLYFTKSSNYLFTYSYSDRKDTVHYAIPNHYLILALDLYYIYMDNMRYLLNKDKIPELFCNIMAYKSLRSINDILCIWGLLESEE